MGEGDNVLDAENLAKEEQLKKIQADIMNKVNDMRDKEEISEAEIYDLILRVSNDKSGDIEIFFKQAKSKGSPSVIVSETKVATISDKGITYNAKAINNYLQMCRQYNIPTNEKYEEIEELANLKERQGDDSKGHEEDGQEKEHEKKKKFKEDLKEQPEENNDKDKENNEKDKTPKFTKPGKDWIKINPNMQVDAVETVKSEFEKKTGSIAEMYIAPNPRDVNDYSLMVKRPGNEEFDEIPLKNSKGTNPTTNITEFNDNGINTTVSVQMLELNGNRFIAVDYDGVNFTRVMIVNRTRENNYIGHEIADRNKPVLDKPSFKTRKMTGDTLDARISGDGIQRVYEEAQDLQKQGVPDDVNPAKNKEAKIQQFQTEKEFNDDLIKEIVEDLRDEVSHASERELYGMATRIAEKMDDRNDYEKAKTEEILAKEDENREYAPTNRRGI